MTRTTLEVDGMRLELPREWADVTGDLDVDDPPLTLARPDGGVLQLSLARYAGGDEPNASAESLDAMIGEFVAGQQIGNEQPDDRAAWEASGVSGCGRSFLLAASDELTRVWYVSDGANLVLVTFCVELPDPAELDEAEKIVRSLRFDV